jgi:hypothetical protein
MKVNLTKGPGSVADSCKHGNGTLGFVKDGDLFTSSAVLASQNGLCDLDFLGQSLIVSTFK